MKNKKISKCFVLCGLFLSTLALGASLTSCGGNTSSTSSTSNPSSVKVTVQSITLDITNVKTVFAYGEDFTYEGLKVQAKMSDGSTKDLSLAEYSVSTPDTKKVGKTNVTVSYLGVSEKYEITILEKEMAPIDSTSLVDIVGENEENAYRVEAEDINTTISKLEGKEEAPFIKEIETGSNITSGNKYLTNFGVIDNYFGFTFTADKDYDNITLVFRMAYAGLDSLSLSEGLKIYMNYKTMENNGVLDIDSKIVHGGNIKNDETEEVTIVENAWEDVVLRNVSVVKGINTLTFEVTSDKVPNIDYIDFYVGKRYISSVVNFSEVEQKFVDLEDFDTEKSKTRQDIVDHYHLKPGELFIESAHTNLENTHGGKAVGAIVTGSEFSTTLRAGADTTISFDFRAASVENCVIKTSWEFYIDGTKLINVEDKNIKKGNPAASQYWEWVDTNLGVYNLPAGDHLFTVKVVGSSCNVDGFNFNVLSYGEFSTKGVDLDKQTGIEDPNKPDTGDSFVINEGKTIVEGEEFKTDKVVTRQDFIDRGLAPGSVSVDLTTTASGGRAICGFTDGTIFDVDFYNIKTQTLKISLVGANDADYPLSNFEFSLDNTVFTPKEGNLMGTTHDGIPNYWDWQTVELLTQEITEGKHTLSIKIKTGHPNIDCLIFETVEA